MQDQFPDELFLAANLGQSHQSQCDLLDDGSE